MLIHSIYDSSHLLTPSSHSIPPPAPSVAANTSELSSPGVYFSFMERFICVQVRLPFGIAVLLVLLNECPPV